MAAKARLLELVAANAPVLYLHPADRYMPCSVDWFLQHSELRRLAPGGGDEVLLLERGAVTAAALADAQATHGSGGQLDLHLLQAGRLGCPKELLDDVPLYVNAKEVVDASGRAEALELNYLTLYAHNGPYPVFGSKVGAHDGDWEHLTVRLDAETGRTLGAYYHAHRNHDGVWVAAADLPRCRVGSGRPAAYVALHGHGTYPSAGRQLRAMLFANDHCSHAGPVWRPRRCFLLPHLSDMSPDAAHADAPAPGQRRLMRVPSRGSSLALPPLPKASEAPRRHAAPHAAGGTPGGNGATVPQPNGNTHGQAQSVAAAAMAPGTVPLGGVQMAQAPADGAESAASAAPAQPESVTLGGVEVAEAPAEWLRFAGRWGTLGGGTPSPATQRWFLQARAHVTETCLWNLRSGVVRRRDTQPGDPALHGVIAHKAEPPVSRTLLRRILHFPAEAQLPHGGA